MIEAQIDNRDAFDEDLQDEMLDRIDRSYSTTGPFCDTKAGPLDTDEV